MTLDHKYTKDPVFFALKVKPISACVTCVLLLSEHLTIKDLKEILEETVPTIVKSWENKKKQELKVVYASLIISLAFTGRLPHRGIKLHRADTDIR